MNTNIPQILRRPLTLTEKGATLKETLNKVMFEVARDASKTQIRAAVEGAFSVKVVDVRTMIVRAAAPAPRGSVVVGSADCSMTTPSLAWRSSTA